MITIEKTVISETEPQVTNVGWFKPSTGELKYFSDGMWISAGDASVLISGVLNLIEDTTNGNLAVTLQLKNEQGEVVEEKTETVEPNNSIEMELT